MSEEQLKAFLEAVQSDTGLQEKLKSTQTLEEASAIAKEAGFMLSSQEFQTGLEDAELEAAAGGGFAENIWNQFLAYQMSPATCPNSALADAPQDGLQ
ncbi:Nif11-like leader peptide family natural product precursor [Synechococcus sp. NOUM97013]|uniref:Nif11-like leader peptide family natural product precursor n=1 Tax=Synechococcus sp. NOUM97013 TaxID=1442555 RepID=UPI0016480509|nr:Nif11-like leader peptide family natural product precursor [Synechococcus sp. NOUM97013]QNI73599.1 nif11-like leader peptide domain protein [Synechococcus sp. NOUM97013]